MSRASGTRALEVFREATIYFAIVFGTGLVLGTIRVPLAVPRFGERVSELIEMPFMLIAIIFAAGVIKPSYVGRPIVALSIGLFALILLVSAEAAFVVMVRRQSIPEYIERRDPVSGTVYVVMLAGFALMPWIVARRASSNRR